MSVQISRSIKTEGELSMIKQWNISIDGTSMDNTEIIDAVTQNRNIDDLYEFLHPDDSLILPFSDFYQIDKAANLILSALEGDKRIGILFDVDQDGISSGSIASKWLAEYNDADVWNFINDGKEHGLSKFSMDALDKNGIDLLWIVDSIETKSTHYQTILDKGIDIVITDHHIVTNELKEWIDSKENIALVSSAVEYNNPALSGAGVTWKFCKYLDWILMEDSADDLVDLAAIGIVADMCSVGTDAMENRAICSMGFENQKNLAIKKINGSYKFNAQAVSFGIAPLTNAAMRTHNNAIAMRMFLDDDEVVVADCMKTLRKCKELQNNEISDLMPELLEQGKPQIDNKFMFFFVDTDSDITGLLGNRLCEEFQRPVFVLREKIDINPLTGEVREHQYAGSCRGYGVDNMKRYIERTGLGWSAGHENAMGFGIDVVDFDYFVDLLTEEMKDVEFVLKQDVDVKLTQDQVNTNLINQIKDINKISGTGFKPINVMIENVDDYEVAYMSNGKHLKIVTEDMIFIKWNYNGDGSEFTGPIDFVGFLDCGYFGRTFYKQLIINDWRQTDAKLS